MTRQTQTCASITGDCLFLIPPSGGIVSTVRPMVSPEFVFPSFGLVCTGSSVLTSCVMLSISASPIICIVEIDGRADGSFLVYLI